MSKNWMTIHLTINGHTHTKAVRPSMTLLEFIREELDLTGTKKGCDEGDCGICTVLFDSKPMLSCLLLAVEAQGREITTIEDIATPEGLHPVQTAMVQEGAIQCGYCTPAMVLNGVYLNRTNPNPSLEDVKTCISGTICRCTGYLKIEKALLSSAENKGDL